MPPRAASKAGSQRCAAVPAAASTPRRCSAIPERFWHIGIHIEDDAAVPDTGCELISRSVPVAAGEIEALMRG